ncbi:MAG: hypothetical protein IPL65_14765 [Lewinellaceae bacterium]|nr:hypothetical protein [Lewinellaceae bacterium]
MQPPVGGNLAFSEQFDGPATGWQAGISLNFHPNAHWQWSVGLLRRQLQEFSSHRASLRLLDGVCLNPNSSGPKEYQFDYSLLSGADQTRVSIRIAQVDSANLMPLDETFTLDMHTRYQNSSWVLPLSLQRNFGQARLRGFVRCGVDICIPGQSNVQVEHFSEACEHLCFNKGVVPRLNISKQDKTEYLWSTGVGVSYQIRPGMLTIAKTQVFGRKSTLGTSIDVGLQIQI